MPGRGNLLIFGKIQLASDSARMDELEDMLGRILIKYHYPEAGKQWSDKDEEDLKELKEDIAPPKKAPAMPKFRPKLSKTAEDMAEDDIIFE